LPSLLQHQAFLATDQPAIQFAKPASQSYGLEDVTQPPPWFGHPLPWTLQHHSFFPTDQPACQFAKPSAQLYGSAGGVGGCGCPQRWWMRQHQSFLSAAQVFHSSTAQLKGSTGPIGTGLLVGRGGVVPGGGVGGRVGGFVGNGVGGGGGGVVLGRAVVQPLPIVWQQNCCWAGDQLVSHISKPASQSYGSEVGVPEHSHRRSGIRSNKLKRQHVVIRQVKSLRGRAKSPPQPTYLYVVSWM